jgi:hypothetical protein
MLKSEFRPRRAMSLSQPGPLPEKDDPRVGDDDCTESSSPVDVPGRLDDHLGVLGVALATWATRDDSRAQPEVTCAGHTAVEAIDAMLGELHRARQQLVTEIRGHQDIAAARVDALLARYQDREAE